MTKQGLKHLFLIALVLFIASGCQTIQTKKPKAAPSNLNMVLKKADLLYKKRQLTESSRLYNQVLRRDPQNIEALYKMGNIAFIAKDYDVAASFYEKTIALSPRHSKAQYNLAMSQLSLAEKHFKFYMATANDDPENLEVVSEIIQFLDQISSNDQAETKSTSLDQLTDKLLTR